MEFIVALLGCVLGYVGWRQSRTALAEVAALRAVIAGSPAPISATPAASESPFETAPNPAATDVPPPAPPPVAEPAPPRRRVDIELLLTQRWGIWLGAVALLLAGVFLVRTAVEQEWLGPAMRCALGALLGMALIGVGWWLRRRPGKPLPLADQVPSGLVAGGVAVLFAAAYAAGPLYGLVPEFAALVLMGGAGVAGLALSVTFGPIVAAVGLVASFGTPALVEADDPSMPGLFVYVLVVTAACWAVVRFTAWVWLGWGAALAGAGWVMLSAAPAGNAAWAPGLFVPAAASLTFLLLPSAALDRPAGRRFAWAPMLMLGLGGLVLEATTADPWVRAGVLLLGPIAIAAAWAEARLAWLPLVGGVLSVMGLLFWAVPGFGPTADTITIEGMIQAVIPGAWLPAAILPFLEAALAVAALHAAAGLWQERRSANPVPWAGSVALVPVLALSVAFLQVAPAAPRAAWAAAAGLLALALAGAAALARPGPHGLQRAGVHAAGAVAALTLGFAIVLETAWLTVALALVLPALAWIEGAAGLPALRRVALGVAAVVLVRLLLNPWLIDYPLGTTPLFNVVLVAYGLPAMCFAAAAILFRRQADDVIVRVLEAGACIFGALFLLLEVHQAGETFLSGRIEDQLFAEVAWWTTMLALYAVLLRAIAQRWGRRVLAVSAAIAGGLSLLLGFGLLLLNPFINDAGAGSRILLNALLPAYLFPAALTVLALRQGARPPWLLGTYAFLALLMWCSATVRQVFNAGDVLSTGDTSDAELWAYSGAWFALAACMMAAGLALGHRALRLAALGLIALVVAKVFLIDMSGLQGLWRVLSFLGLGLGLMALGALYRRFGMTAAPPGAPPGPAPAPDLMETP